MGRPHHGCGGRRHDLDLHLDLDPGGGGTNQLLKYLTRLLFVTIVTSSTVVLAGSVFLLTQCRGQVKAVEDLVQNSHGLCTQLPIPAYFACVVIVVAVFGFGCVGRKVSGLLLMGVSVVAMVIAVVVVVTQECDQDVLAVRRALVMKLEQCGLLRGTLNNASELHPTQLHRFEYLASDDLRLVCQDTVSSLTTLCGELFVMDSSSSGSDTRQGSDRSMNQTGVETCAKHVALSMYSLCMEDTEIVYPVLLTLPLFYMGIGVALVYIKHADVKAKSGVSVRTRNSVGTNTDRSSNSPDSGSSGKYVLSRCLTSLCVNHSLCFTCLLRGNACSCCSTPSTLRPSSRLSFQLRELKEGGGIGEEGDEEEREASVRMLRTASPSEPHEELQLMDECV